MTKNCIILAIVILGTTKVFCQDNSLKGFIVPALYFNTVTVGYERKITKHSSIDLVGHAEMSLLHFKYSSYSQSDFRIGYKYYLIVPDDKFLNNHWVGAYYTQIKENISTCSEGSGFVANNIGVGISFGKQFNFSERKKTFINLGFRLAYLKRYFLSRTSCDSYFPVEVKEEDNYFYLRPGLILNFGYKF